MLNHTHQLISSHGNSSVSSPISNYPAGSNMMSLKGGQHNGSWQIVKVSHQDKLTPPNLYKQQQGTPPTAHHSLINNSQQPPSISRLSPKTMATSGLQQHIQSPPQPTTTAPT